MNNRWLLALSLGLSLCLPLGTMGCGDLTRPSDLQVSKDRASLTPPAPDPVAVAEAAGVRRPNPAGAVRFPAPGAANPGGPSAAGASPKGG